LKSYAQNFEDVMLWRALKHVENGFYIDIGAQDPVIDSVNLGFYEQGWCGIHVEPNEHYAQLLRDSRPNESVIQAAVGSENGVITFYEIADTGLSTCDSAIAERHRVSGFIVRKTNVPSVTLDSIFQSCAKRQIHWLKIDVEGFEQQVLEGWRLSKARPWIVVVESTLPSSQIESHAIWEDKLLKFDYVFVYFDGLNRFYIHKKHLDLKNAFSVSPNLFDGFALSGTASNSFSSILNYQLAAREQDLSAQIAQGKTELLKITQTLATREQDLSAQIKIRDLELINIQERGQWLEKECKYLKEQASHLRSESELRCSELKDLLSEAQAGAWHWEGRLQQEKILSEEKYMHLYEELSRVHVVLENQIQYSTSLEVHLNKIIGGFSWKITKPIRIFTPVKNYFKTRSIEIKGHITSLGKALVLYAISTVARKKRIKRIVKYFISSSPSLKKIAKSAYSQINIDLHEDRNSQLSEFTITAGAKKVLIQIKTAIK